MTIPLLGVRTQQKIKIMLTTLKNNYKLYLIEAWALGMFMVSAAVFVILIEHPALPIRQNLESGFVRRLLVGLAMGLTAIALIYSKWGKISGAHMNPAVTLAFLSVQKINFYDAVFYILAQFIGGTFAVYLFKWFLFAYISDPSVNYVVTVPGEVGVEIAFIAEFVLSFMLFTMVMLVSNYPKLADYTGYFAGTMVFLFITFEAPYSGMSINPARTFASALPANVWTGIWIYCLAPVLGMLSAGLLYRRIYFAIYGSCEDMECHLAPHLPEGRGG